MVKVKKGNVQKRSLFLAAPNALVKNVMQVTY